MKFFLENEKGRTLIEDLSYAQSKQAVAIMDAVARLIPQEGIDYDVNITFKGEYNPSVSMKIEAHTDKGEFWKQYVAQMIGKYPPKVDYAGDALPENPIPPEEGEQKEEPDAEIVS